MKRPASVAEFIASVPKEVRGKLRQMRQVIKQTAPGAQEKISYGMPYYGYKGRLAYFAYASKHVGLYIPPPVIAMHKKELKGYGTATATVRFPLNKKLPIPLIKKLLRARLKLNSSRSP